MSAATATTPCPQKGNRHTMNIVTQARDLAAGGMKPREIAARFREQGVSVHYGTIYRWTSDRHAEYVASVGARARAQRAARSGRQPFGQPGASPELRLARIKTLAELGVPLTSIGVIMRHDFGDELTIDQLRHVMRGGIPRPYRTMA